MTLRFEIGGHRSAIVVTLSGATDLAALRPVQAAMSAAIAAGETVVIDLDKPARLDPGVLIELLEQAQPQAGQVRLVAGKEAAGRQMAALGADRRICMYPSVEAALADRSAAPAGRGDVPGGDLPAKFAQLSDQYRAAIDQCRQVLHRLEDATHSAPWSPLEPGDGALHQKASERSQEKTPA